MVFYRKYRPQKISELDSSSLREALYSIFGKGLEGPHAFLFSGPKGLGKTSTARIVAKVINCEKHQGSASKKKNLSEVDIEPDNKCWQCQSITNGTNFDVLEIDGASNRGIDEIRDLREKINLLPSKAFKKVYIIDEVHMLTTEAFNALLKTLEEPPPHAVFMLCTTELHKVPQTIVSRCFRVDFKKATNEEIARSLLRIIKGEGIKADKDALSSIAKLADGSFRDAAKILEEVSLFAGRKEITEKIVSEKFNTLGLAVSLSSFAQALKDKDAKKGFEVIQKLSEQGIDFKFFIENLLNTYHDILLNKMGAGSSPDESGLDIDEVRKLLELLSKAHQETKYAVLQQLPLELLLVEWAGQDNLTSEPSQEPSAVPTKPKTQEGDFTSNFINEVKSHNHLIAGVLRSCELEKKDGNLRIVAISKFHKEKLEDSKTFEILENVAMNLLSKKVKIEIVLGR